ncbi:methyltransferase domain-containing protein [candidate division GN15 bacterium]|nr:methyltransferase domain-containing protein [candidate division GN15 bacterium]
MTDYYAKRLAGRRLQRCYELASDRVQRYLESEIRHVCSFIEPHHAVVELGCGYGRVAMRLAEHAKSVTGIDVAAESLELAADLGKPFDNLTFEYMDALDMAFPDAAFDILVCIQNGICAFGVDQAALLREALRVTRPGGLLLLSSYSDTFWPHRLAWFEAQSSEGLLGPIDYDATGDGVIACTDGFRSGRLTPEQFASLCATVGMTSTIREVDHSGLFCEIVRP